MCFRQIVTTMNCMYVDRPPYPFASAAQSGLQSDMTAACHIFENLLLKTEVPFRGLAATKATVSKIQDRFCNRVTMDRITKMPAGPHGLITLHLPLVRTKPSCRENSSKSLNVSLRTAICATAYGTVFVKMGIHPTKVQLRRQTASRMISSTPNGAAT